MATPAYPSLKSIVTLIAATCLASFAASHATAAADARPNIVLIVTDDQGIDSVAAYGNDAIRTPHLDALARQGVRFTRGFASASSCSVSRSVLLTGRHGHATGMYGHIQHPHHFSAFDDVKALPVLLRESGYRTAMIGKYHLAPKDIFDFAENLGDGLGGNGYPIIRSPVEMADASEAFIARNKDEPFFLYYAPLDPHRGPPFGPDAPNNFGNRPDGYPGAPPDIYDPDEVAVPSYLPDLPEVRAETAEYYRSVARIDKGVGRLVEHLKTHGAWDNTVVIFLSDNGYAQPGAKTNLYEPGVNLPLIVRSPDQQTDGAVSDALVSWADITPTLLDYADQEAPATGEFAGVSFRPLMTGAAETVRERAYGSHTFHEITMYYPMRMVRDARYKLIWNPAAALPYPSGSQIVISSTVAAINAMETPKLGARPLDAYRQRDMIELYDLEADPDELVNLADDPEHADIRDALIARLKTFQEETNDPWLVKWSYE